MKHLVIISFGASGTNAVVDQLFNNTPFWNHSNKEPLNINFLKYNKDLSNKSYHWYVDHIKKMMENAEKENKILLIHIKPGHFLDLKITLKEGIDILKERFDFITIKRNNYLANICSGEVKKVAKTSTTFKKIKFPYCGQKLLSLFQRMEIINDVLPTYISPNKCIHLDYESEINKDVRAASDKITKFYGIYENYNYEKKRFNFHAQKNKWSNIPLKDKIENWEEIVKDLKGTKYEWMLVV